ncbi:MAG: hypothetical protein Q8L48_21115 [Archangium sp.]|nr:hypothetical protein [Archangium sp.]
MKKSALLLLAFAACNQATPTRIVTLEHFTVAVPGVEFPTHSALQLEATALYSDGSRVNVTADTDWTSADPTIGSIGATGIVQLRGVGLARFQGTFEGRTVPIEINATGAELESLTVSSTSSGTLARGDTRRFTARARFSDGSSLDVTERATWLAQGPLSFTEAGVVVGSAEGPALVRAVYFSQQHSVNVEVSAPRFVRIAMAAPAVTIRPGDTQRLVLQAVLSDGSTRDVSTEAAWHSSDSNVVDLSTNGALRGVFFARATGRARVTATWDQASIWIDVMVHPRLVAELGFDVPDLQLAQGRSEALAVFAQLDDGARVDVSSAASWSSSQPGVAEVTSGGAVITHAMGLTTISARYAGLVATYDVQVTPPVLVELSASLGGGRLLVGQAATFVLLGTFTDGAQLNLSPVAVVTHGPQLTSALAGDRLKITAEAHPGATLLDLEVGPLRLQIPLEVSDALLATLEIRPGPTHISSSLGAPFQGPRRFRAVATYTDGAQLDVTELCNWWLDDAAIATLSDQPGSRGVYVFADGGTTVVRASMMDVIAPLVWDFPVNP